MAANIIDPRDERYALVGRIVTMNDNFEVLESGTIYIHNGVIVDVRASELPAPAGFESSPVIETGGTVFPGLIELHNHLSYNVLPLWNVPETFKNRGEWRDHPDKRKLITAPMSVLGRSPTYVEAVVRYVECKCLLSGVTTSQGISLYGVRVNKYYRGVVRNVEAPTDPRLPAASTKISDVDDVESFWQKLQHEDGCFLLHLSEGLDASALKHFEALQLPNHEWAITEKLAGIHSTALRQKHFDILATHKGAIVWSPLSNLMLYGQTTDIGAAIKAGVVIGLGSDWSPTGSKNLLGEIKVAHLVAKASQTPLSSRDIVSMVTKNAATILNWQDALGSIEAGKQADLVVIHNQANDPYDALIAATEREIDFVVIRGIPRYGKTALMQKFGTETELVSIDGEVRLLNLWEEVADPAIAGLTLEAATTRLHAGFKQLVELAKRLEDSTNLTAQLANTKQIFGSLTEAYTEIGMPLEDIDQGIDADRIDSDRPPIFLDLDEEYFEGLSEDLDLAADESLLLDAAVPYSKILESTTINLDPLTILDDPNYFPLLVGQMNLPDYIKIDLPKFYGITPELPSEIDFLTEAPETMKLQFLGATDLASFLNQPGYLTMNDRLLLVQQALLLLERVYVHLPMKRSMHAVDPMQRLRLLQYELEDESLTPPPEMVFHRAMLSIFTSLRDLHTSYSLPFPFRDKVAFLPFLIEEFSDEQRESHYIVSKVVGHVGPESFKPNIEVLYWNGIPIRRAIELNAERHAGSNPAASYVRGLDSLTIRPLTYSLPPDEEWVTIRYRTEDGRIEELTQKWLVFTPSRKQLLFRSDDSDKATVTAVGLDWYADAIQQVKSALYAPDAVEAAKRSADSGQPQQVTASIDTTMPTVFRARPVDDNCGYIRIFTFNVDDAETFVDEFVRLVSSLPPKGLIIDIRGNGGGLIHAAERLLQVLTSVRPIEPSRAQFINSSLIYQLCKLHSPSKLIKDFTLEYWKESVRQAVRTGATYSQAIPITDPKTCNNRERAYPGPVVLIVDAMCYSAADIFAAGFQDHDIGAVIGVSDNTGAGGANVWGYGLLQYLMTDPSTAQKSVFKSLPHGADMRVAIRRTLRVRDQAGTQLEDLGINIRPDHRHYMTRVDLLESNIGLIEYASNILSSTLHMDS